MAGRTNAEIKKAIEDLAQSTLPYLEDYKIVVTRSKGDNIVVKEVLDSTKGELTIGVQVPTNGKAGALIESPMLIPELVNYSRDEHDESDIYLFLDAIQEDIALSGGLEATAAKPAAKPATPTKKKRTAKREPIDTIRTQSVDAEQRLLSSIVDGLVSRVEYGVSNNRSLKTTYNIALDLQQTTERVLDTRGDRAALNKLRATLKKSITNLFRDSSDRERLKRLADIFIDDCCGSAELFYEFENGLELFNAALEDILNYLAVEQMTLIS